MSTFALPSRRRRAQSEKQWSLPNSASELDSEDEVPRRTSKKRSFRGRRALWPVLALAAVGTYYATRESPYLASGLAQCKYIATRPGPAADFYARRVSDRFEKGTKAVILRNATIWTGNEEGKEVIKGDVHMDRGLVVAVGKVDSLKGVEEVDVQGAWVTPGIVDGHSHGEIVYDLANVRWS
jgi:hypothetical protein